MIASTLLLLVIIPLYPKLPLLDIRHTWVYVRIEDFFVLFVLFMWGYLVVRKDISLRTPLTLPIFFFWVSGLVATVHGILLIFPSIGDAYPNVAFLSFLRRMEYMSVFFVAYAAMKEKRMLRYVLIVLVLTLFGVAFYGIGQKYLGFFAFLTMNEEFAKGTAIQLSSLSRVSSTFSGHYDLAAYFVLVLPIVISLALVIGNWITKGALLLTGFLGFIVLFMTVSRISLFALLVSLGLVLFMHKKKFVLLSIPIIAVVTIFFFIVSPGMFDRFGNTLKEIDVIVDMKTGDTVGHSKEVVNTYFSNKTVKQQFSRSITSLDTYASPSATIIVPYTLIEDNAVVLVEPNAPTGENLPQGTGYVNLSLSPVIRKLDRFYYEPNPRTATTSAEVYIINGDYILKKVLAYDLSFTTRFQGEWPRAIGAFTRNIFLGSGYGSVGMAVDNSYLRMLAEVGLLGFGMFFAIFIIIGIYIRNVYPDIDSLEAKSFIIGFVAGMIGLFINAFFIDVFEASKVAFLTWLLCGIVLGIHRLYQRSSLNIINEIKQVVVSPFSIIVGLFFATILLYIPMFRNNFVGDDFTWFRWAATSNFSDWYKPFFDSGGFFYRPGARLYFLGMYSIFWLNQTVFHFISAFLHAVVIILVFLLGRKIFKSLFVSGAGALLFLVFSGYSEAVHWISATGFLFTACFTLTSLLFYIRWLEIKKASYLIACMACMILSLLFHELGIVTPFLIFLYTVIFFKQVRVPKLLFSPIPVYLFVRYLASSHWLSGDYNYNLFKLPLNAVGNAFGYILLTLFGPVSISLYQTLRSSMKAHSVITFIIVFLFGLITIRLYRNYQHKIEYEDRRIMIFGFFFFVISLLPFLGLGNLTSRYSYLSSIPVAFVGIILLKQVHRFLMPNGKILAHTGIVLMVGVFSLFHIIQKQQLHNDWYEAGEKTRKFIVAMDGAYQNNWGDKPLELHLVNVPIRVGEAWVFPVGISDALWMIFRNPNIRVFTWPTLSQAFNAVTAGSNAQRVFQFKENGEVVEMEKPQTAQ